MAQNFYGKLYNKEPCTMDGWQFPCVSHNDRHWLNWGVSVVEILAVVKEMGVLKAPGLDGFPPIFL